MPVFKLFVRPLHFVECVISRNFDRQRTIEQSSKDVTRPATDRRRVGEIVGEARPREKKRAGFAEFDRIEIFDRSANTAVTDHQAFAPSGAQAIAKGWLADCIKYDVDPTASGQRTHHFDEAPFVVEENSGSTSFSGDSSFRLGAGCGIDCGAHPDA